MCSKSHVIPPYEFISALNWHDDNLGRYVRIETATGHAWLWGPDGSDMELTIWTDPLSQAAGAIVEDILHDRPFCNIFDDSPATQSLFVALQEVKELAFVGPLTEQ